MAELHEALQEAHNECDAGIVAVHNKIPALVRVVSSLVEGTTSDSRVWTIQNYYILQELTKLRSLSSSTESSWNKPFVDLWKRSLGLQFPL